MSARSSTSSSRPDRGAGEAGYLGLLAAALGFWLALFLAITLLVDPYGISPVKLTIEGVNTLKPRRVDIDRILKPVEVWQQAPRTIVLGTSRTHQGIDPSAFAGTKLAPAYNASIPNGSLPLHEGHLRHYAAINPRLDTVIVELFVYNFLIPVPPGPAETPPSPPPVRFGIGDLAANARDLLFSMDTIAATIDTVLANRLEQPRGNEILAGGQYHIPPGHDAHNAFSAFPPYVWTLHPVPPEVLGLNPHSFALVRAMQDLADEKGFALTFLVAPDNPIFDYYIDQAGAWDLIAQWLTRISSLSTVLVPGIPEPAQPDRRVHEPIGPEMTYWYDPFHFTPELGRAMVDGLTGRSDYLVRLTPDRVPELVANRRQALARWAAENPGWVARMQDALAAHQAGGG